MDPNHKGLTGLGVTVVGLPQPGPNEREGSDHTAVTCRLRLPPTASVDAGGVGGRADEDEDEDEVGRLRVQ